jgi:hypothetical protein
MGGEGGLESASVHAVLVVLCVCVWAPLFPFSLLSLSRFILCPDAASPLLLHATNQPTHIHAHAGKREEGGERNRARFDIAHSS